MRRLGLVLAPTLVTLLATTASRAQHLYVPLTSYPGDGTVLELVVTNPDAELTRLFSGVILPEGANGMTTNGTATEQIGVAPRSTRVVVGPAGIGLWRLDGHDGLQISARLRVPGGASALQGDAVPILSRDSVYPANATVEAQSQLAASGFLSDFGIFNAGQSAAHCEANARLANGTLTGQSPYPMDLPPLSFHFFENVPTALVPGGQASDVHISVRCDREFFVLSRTVNPETGYVSIHPAGTALASGLPEPGSPPPPPPPPPPPGNTPPAATSIERFTRAGAFYTPTVAEPSLLFVLPVTPNVAFSQIAISFDVEHGGWDPSNPSGVVNVLYLTRDQFDGDVFALITTRGPDKNVVRNETNVDLPRGGVVTKVAKVGLQPGATYHVDYLYDATAGRWTLAITEGGVNVVNLASFTPGPVWTLNGTWTLLLSEDPREGHAPSLGWVYSDLTVEWRP